MSQPSTINSRISFSFLLIILVTITAIGLRLTQWISPPASPPLLTQVEGMIRLSSLEELPTYTETQVKAPSETFGASLHVIGLYPHENSVFPKNTVALVYTRNNARFIEINFRPNRTLKQELANYTDLPTQSIMLNPDSNAVLVKLREQPYCQTSNKTNIGSCQLTRALIVEWKNDAVILFADGRHATDGELIKMAQSIVDEE